MMLIIILTRKVYLDQTESSTCFTLAGRLRGEISRFLRIHNRLLKSCIPFYILNRSRQPKRSKSDCKGSWPGGARSTVSDVVNWINRFDRSGWHCITCMSWILVLNYLHDLNCWSGKCCRVRRLLITLLTFTEKEINTKKSRIQWSYMPISPYQVGQYLQIPYPATFSISECCALFTSRFL